LFGFIFKIKQKMNRSVLLFQLLSVASFLLVGSLPFSISPKTRHTTRTNIKPTTLRLEPLQGTSAAGDEELSLSWNRRDFLSLTPISVASGCLLLGCEARPSWAASAESFEWGTSPDSPVAVLGGGGRTGMEVARALAKQGIYAVTMTRTGRDPYQVIKLAPEIKQYIQHYPEPVNVVDGDALKASLSKIHASAIVFCASSSKQGGTVFQVDDQGVGNAAAAAKELDVRLVVVSALAVDRPDSKSFQITNTLGGNLNGIMDAKRQGEESVRKILEKSKNYVIVRPGVLLSGKSPNGPSGIQLNQGDTIGGGLSRDELAGAVVGALVSKKRGATVEVYRTSTATALQPEFKQPNGRELTANTYAGLFDSVQAD
jgi:nucleoside-diphosphate-sugar epimerase